MKKTRRLALCAILVGVALILGLVESFFNIVPVPGIKLGLANIVFLFALYRLGGKDAFVIMLLKCILGSVFSGSITAFLFSLCGGILSISVMALVKKSTFVSMYGVSMAGACAHGFGQIIAAIVLLRTVGVVFYLPFLLVSGLVCGVIIAFVTNLVYKNISLSAIQ